MLRTQLRKWFGNGSRSARRPERKSVRPGMELLEDRILLDTTAGIVVGRTLSAYTTADVQDNRITLTYTVYNQQADPITGVLLTSTLQPGVTLQSASQHPDRNGSELAWSLGTVEGFGRASVEITLSRDGSNPLQLDNGARAFGTRNAGMISDDTPAATLRTDAIAAALLAPTPDANSTDPFIQEQAAELDYDPQRVIDYLKGAVRYESYSGSLRGSRGTLWSSAGNALDEASLGVALMRASGIPAQYAQGTLADERARELILSMFPTSFRTVGHIPTGTAVGDPANDPKLLAETRDHSWFQFDTGGGLRDIDTTMAGAQVGQTFAATAATFTEVPAALRHTVTVKLDAETFNQASAAFGVGDGLSTRTVLSQTFNAVDLVGKPLTVGHLVNVSSIGTPLVSVVTNSYTPYFDIYDPALPEESQPHAITGTGFQEVFTNFPLSTQVLTGLFLKMTVSGPGGPPTTYERSLVDRIGYAARQGLGAPGSVSVDPSGPPIITPHDLTTLNILPGLQAPRAAQLLAQRAEPRLDSLSSPTEPREVAQVQALTAATRDRVAQFAVDSDLEAANLAAAYLVAAYFASPRITAFSTRILGAPTESKVAFEIDLINDSIRAVVAPGQSVEARTEFAGTRGLFDSFLEAFSLPTTPESQNRSAIVLLQRSLEQGIPLATISGQNLGELQHFDLPAEAIARITRSVQDGLTVVVPGQALTVDGDKRTAWLEVHPTTGEMIAVGQDGRHQGINEFAAKIYIAIYFGALAFAMTWIKDPFHHDPVEASKAGLSSFGINLLTGVIKKALATIASKIALLKGIDPPLMPLKTNLNLPYPTGPNARASTALTAQSSRTAGPVAGTVQSNHTAVSGSLTASWTETATSSFVASTLDATGAIVVDSQGNTVGSGTATVSAPGPLPVSISGNTQYRVNGQGDLSFYGPATTNVGVAGNWEHYTANLTGNVTLDLTTDALLLNGVLLPAGRYTITTNAATLSGSGHTSSPNFAGSVSINAIGATVTVGPSTGNVTAGGTPLEPGNGFTVTGYNGSLDVTAGAAADSVVLNGSAANMLTLSGSPATLTTDQNTPVTFRATVATSLAGEYTLTAEAPAGWVVTIDNDGDVTATPAPGLQGGTFPIRLVAQSTTDPKLVAQGVVEVTMTPTAPGITLSVERDELITVPFNGSQVPTAFRAVLHNTGPTADTFNLTFPNLPAGFTILNSGTTVTVPAGETAFLGIYLQPSGQLPAPGTPVSFAVTATSTTAPAITATATQSFTMPEVHGVTLVATPTELNSTPGTPVDTTLTLRAVGNVPENVTFSTNLPAGLALSGLSPASLAVGETATRTLTLTPSESAPLNSTLTAAITANFAGAEPQTLGIPVQLLVPGARAIADAAAAVQQLGNGDLADRLGDLSIALTNLVQTPTSEVFKSQALASLDSVRTQVAADPLVAHFGEPLADRRAELAAANNPAAIQNAVESLGDELQQFARYVTALSRHNVSLFLNPSTRTAVPLVPQTFDLVLHNIGTHPTTYELSVPELPTDVQSQFSQSTVTLNSNEIRTVPFTLTQTSTTNLTGFGFTVQASFTDNVNIVRSTRGAITPRREFVSVVDVTVTPPFADPGNSVAVKARLLNGVNRQQEARVSYRVLNASGALVVPPSAPVPVTLGVVTSLVEVDLGTLATTGLALGQYTIEVTVTDAQGVPIPDATGTGALLIGSPVTADLTTGPTTLPPGTSIVTNTLQIDSQTVLNNPFRVLGQAAAPGASDVIRNGDFAYVATSSGIRVYDIAGANVNNPQLLRTVGTAAHRLQMRGNLLVSVQTLSVISAAFRLDTYSLADPANPQPLGTTGSVPYAHAVNFVLTDTHAFVVMVNLTFDRFSNSIHDQVGAVVSINLTNPAAPFFDGDAVAKKGTPEGRDGIDDGVLFNDYGTGNDGIRVFDPVDTSGGPRMTWDVKQVAPTIILVTGSSSTLGNTQTGVGLVRVIDVADPRQPRLLRDLQIPGTVHAFSLAVDGNRAFVTATEGGLANFTPGLPFTGRTVLATLDLSDPANPQLLDTLVMSDLARTFTFSTALGNGLYSFGTGGLTGNEPRVYLADASDPENIVLASLAAPATPTPRSGGGNLLFTTDNSSLILYEVLGSVGIPITARVRVPRNTGVTIVPNSFNVAPTEIVAGPDFDTLVWESNLTAGLTGQSFTWQTTVADLHPGEARDVTLASTIDFTSQGTPGRVTLPPQNVFADQVLTLDPAARTVRPGESATYTLTIENPAATPVTYQLAVVGVPPEWVAMQSLVSVPAGGSLAVPLTLTSSPSAPPAGHAFVVTATTGSVSSTVQGSLTLQGDPMLPQIDPEAHGVALGLTPTQAVAGQGTSATFTVRLTNTGSVTETFDLTPPILPGVTAVLDRNFVTVPPGTSNFREVRLTLTAGAGVSPNAYAFAVTAKSRTSTATDSVNGSLTVVSPGVRVTLDRTQGNPGETFQLTVTNTGTIADTFDLSLAGPAALRASLAVSRVSLAAGASQVIPLTTTAVSFAVPGSLTLTAAARSQSNSAVADKATAQLQIAATKGMTAQFAPDTRTLSAPGAASFLLQVDNIGNIEDSYEAVIVGTTGGLVTSLAGLDGQATQKIPVFRLPGLAPGVVPLSANLAAAGAGTVTVQVRSLTDGAVVATATARLIVAPPIPAPLPPPPAPVVGEGIAVLPGGPGQPLRMEVRYLSSRSLFRNEAGVILLDADGRIDGLKPGDPGFLRRALQRRRILVRRGDRPGRRRRVVLPGGSRVLFYLVQNSTLERLLGSNPENQMEGKPLVFLGLSEANPDRRPHVRLGRGRGGAIRIGWEDLVQRSDHDYNDIVLSIRSF